jgi:hypothetical protein
MAATNQMKKTILITGVGGPTPRSFAIALKKYGHYNDFSLIGTDINPLAIGLYNKDLFDKCYLVPRADSPEYWSAIEQIIERHAISMAVILPEVEVNIWSIRASTNTLPCKALLPEHKLVDLLVDKSKMTSVLADSGFVPESIAFSSERFDLEMVMDKLRFPFWVRSSSGTSGLGSLKVENAVDLQSWIKINGTVKHFLASNYLSGRNLACKLLYFRGKLLRSACAERVNYIMAKVAPSGITGNTSFGRLLNEESLVDIATQAMDKLFEHTHSDKHGFFTVDLKEDKSGKPFITEINVRHVAFTQCFAAGGANFAEDTIRLLDGDPTFSMMYKMYRFEDDLIFLRDVDSLPILMKEKDLLSAR